MHEAREHSAASSSRSISQRSCGFCQRLSLEALADLNSIGTLRTYAADEALFGERQPTPGVFLVQEGQVRLSMNSTEGKRLSLRIGRAGDALGLAPAMSGHNCETTAETLTVARILYVSNAQFRAFLNRHPEVYSIVTEEISRQYTLACERLRTVGLSSSAPEKLARLLLDLSENTQIGEDAARIRFMLTHEQIGEFIGASRETVTRTLGSFKTRRLISLNGCMMTIPSRSALQHYAHI
ncbi:MAG TPA: Crp/Fnr family transcriptional regulator [Acidobacteriaceae bacterium]|nr:Crp/Fnr family transcriptional regulator [Acidobacteriaceae bacterium]